MAITELVFRFARDTVTLLETARELKKIDVDVYLEKKDFDTAEMLISSGFMVLLNGAWCLVGV